MYKKALFGVLFLLNILYADPSLEWGNMIGDNVNAPAGFRQHGEMPFDFTVILVVNGDENLTIDSAAITLSLDGTNGFVFPQGEKATKSVYKVRRRTSRYIFWHVTPPGGLDATFPDAITASGTYTIGNTTKSMASVSRTITVARVQSTDQFRVANNVFGDPLAGGFIEVYQTVENVGANPQHFVWGLFLSRYDVLDLQFIQSSFPNAATTPQTYLPNTTGLPRGAYEILYRFNITQGGVPMTLNNSFYGLTGNWRGVDSELAGATIDDWTTQNQGFTGDIIDCGTGQGIANIPITVYTAAGAVYDARPRTYSDGSFSFGLKDPGLYRLYFNDPDRSNYQPSYSSFSDDNNGSFYNLAANTIISVTRCLTYTPPTVEKLYSLVIVPSTALVDAGNTITFQAVGYDSLGHQLHPDSLGTLSWSGGTSIGSFTGTNHNAAFFTTTTAGTDTVQVQSSIDGITGRSGSIIVLPPINTGGLHSISIVPQTTSITVGNTVLFEAVGYDQSGNQLPVDSLGTLTWSGGTRVGSIVDQNGGVIFFTASAVGLDTLHVSSSVNGVTGQTGTITVISGGTGTVGSLDRIGITPYTLTTSTGNTVIFQAVGYDSVGNQLHPDSLGTLTWGGGTTIGSFAQFIKPAAYFTVTAAGTDTITVSSSVGGISASTGTITAIPGGTVLGPLNRLEINPPTASLQVGGSAAFTAVGYDGNNNVLPADSLGTLTWSMAGGIGTFATNTGVSVTFNATTAGTGSLTVVSSLNSVTGRSGAVTVTDAPPVFTRPESLLISIDSATVALDSVLILQVSAIDSNGLVIPAESLETYIAWTGGTLIGSYQDSSGLTALFLITDLGTDSLTITYLNGTDTVTAVSGPIQTVPGVIGSIVIVDQSGSEVQNLTVTTDDDGRLFYLRAYTLKGTYIDQTVSAGWQVIGGGIAAASPSSGSSTALTFTGTGTCRLVAAHTGGAADTTGTITVIAGKAKYLTVSPATATIPADSFFTFTVSAMDADSNTTENTGVVDWSYSGTFNGSFNPDNTSGANTTIFTPGRSGRGIIRAWSVTYNVSGTSDTVTVIPGDPDYIRILPVGPDTMFLSETRTYYAASYDSKDNYIDTVSAVWDTIGALDGTCSAFTGKTFSFTSSATATAISSGRISATSGTMTDTLRLTILPYKITDIEIRWAWGTEVTNFSSTTDGDSVTTFYAVGLDQNGTERGNVAVAWQFEGDPVGFLYPQFGTHTTLVFTAPGTSLVSASYQNGTATDSTGAIIVEAGQTATLEIQVSSYDIETTDTLYFTVTGRDADGNITSQVGTITWSGGASIGTINASTGMFIATTVGVDSITVTSSLGVTATTGPITVRRKVEPPQSWQLLVDNTFPDYSQTVTCTLQAVDRFGNVIPDTFACRYRINLSTQVGADGIFAQPSGTVDLGGSVISTDANGDYIATGELFNGGRLTFTVDYDAAGESLFVTATQDSSNATGTSPGIIWQPQQLLSKVLVYPSPVNFNSQSTMAVQYVLKYDAKVTLVILSATGALVYKEEYISTNGARQGTNNLTWNGRTRKGNNAASGAYVMRFLVEANEGTMTLTRRFGVIGRK